MSPAVFTATAASLFFSVVATPLYVFTIMIWADAGGARSRADNSSSGNTAMEAEPYVNKNTAYAIRVYFRWESKFSFH